MGAISRRVPVRAHSRVIVDNDFAGDPDALVALTHQLLMRSCEVVAICGTSIEPPSGLPGGGHGAAEAAVHQLLDRLNPPAIPLVAEDTSVTLDRLTDLPHGARLIIDAAHANSDLPLIVTCGGPLTNVAAALRHDPSIADRLTLAWIGGGAYPDGGWEYNAALDVAATQYVFNESTVPIVQFTVAAYRQCAYSLSELEEVLGACGQFGAWLYETFCPPAELFPIRDSWPMGDSPVILTTSLGEESSIRSTIPCPWVADDLGYTTHPRPRELSRYDVVDTRLLLADFGSRLRLHCGDD